VQEQSRRQIPRHDVPQVNHLVEIVQLAGVMERVEDKTRHAHQEEVQRARSVAAAEIHKQSDRQIDRADRVLIEER
jgi:hypothetical protein